MRISTLENKVIGLVILLLPFTAFKGIPYLGELKNDLAAHFFVLGIFLFLARSVAENKIVVPKRGSFYLLLLFIVWVLVSSFFNVESILGNYYKGKSGVYRLAMQSILYSFYAILGTLMFYSYVIRNGVIPTFYKVRKLVLYSFLFVSLVGLIEIPIGVYKDTTLKPLYDFLIMLTFKDPVLVEIDVWRYSRISSITQEPPFLAMYLIFSGPWMLSYLLEKGAYLKFIPSFLLLLLTYYSGSRTALALITLQVLFFFYYGLRNKVSHLPLLKIVLRGFLVLFLLFVIFLEPIINSAQEKISDFNVSKKSHHSISNKTRFGTQIAAFEVFKKAPYFGVGLGQQGYYLPKYYPIWASTENWEIKMFRDSESSVWPPGFSMLTRLLCEVGLFGTFLFFSAVLWLLLTVRRVFFKSDDEYNIVSIVTFTVLFGFAINLLQFDSFRLIGFWVTFALAYAILKEKAS